MPGHRRRSGRSRSSGLDAVAFALRPSVDLVASACRLLSGFGLGDPYDLALDDDWHRVLLDTTALLSRITDHVRDPVSFAAAYEVHSPVDLADHNDVIGKCAGHLDDLTAAFGAVEAVADDMRRWLHADAAAEWTNTSQQRRETELFRHVHRVGLPSHFPVLQRPGVAGAVTRSLLTHRGNDRVRQLHASEEFLAHNHGLKVLIRALGNVALPQHLALLSEWTAHPSEEVSIAAVRALRRFPTDATAPVFARLLSAPPADFAAVMADVDPAAFRIEVRQRVMHVIAHQRQPSAAVLSQLHSQLAHIDALAAVHPSGCVAGCYDHCRVGVPRHLDTEVPPAVTSGCESHCVHRCLEMMAYHTHVVNLLVMHESALPTEAQETLSSSRRRLIDLSLDTLKSTLDTAQSALDTASKYKVGRGMPSEWAATADSDACCSVSPQRPSVLAICSSHWSKCAARLPLWRD